MKKTLFLALAFGLTGLTQATVEQADGITHIYGTETSTPSGAVGVVNVGSYKGAGTVTMDSNWTLDNSLYIGGVGYKTGKTPANAGSVTVTTGTTLTVGAATTSASGSHIDVGNSAYAAGMGELIVDGGTVKGEQLVVGQEGGASGTVIIKNNGALDVTKEKTDTGDDYHGIVIYNGTVTVEEGTLANKDALTVISSVSGSAALEVKDEAALGTVLVGGIAGGEGSLKVGSGAVTTVAGDVFVDANGALEVDGISTLTVTEAVPGDIFSGGAIWVDNSDKVTVSGGATIEAEQIELTGSDAKVTLKGDSFINTEVLVLNAGTNVYLSEGVDKQHENLKATETYFTVTADNYATGQIHKDDTVGTNVGHVYVEMTGSLLNSLVAGNRTITLVDSSDKTNNSDYEDVTWRVDDDITYTVEQDNTKFGGLVLQLDKTDATHTDKDALANEIIDSLVSPTSVAAINTLNGTIASLSGLFNVVKSQLQMPHNVDLPVGNVAEDSRLAYTGRYFVGANRAWVSALGASDRVATDFKGEGYHYNGGGYAVGYDRVITPQMYVGAAVGQMIGKYKANNELVRDSQKTYEGTLYAHYTHMMKKSDNRFNVDAFIGGGRARNRARGVMAAGSSEPATGRWNDTSFGCGVRLSYDVMLSDSDIVTPFVGIEGLYAWQDKYIMTNGATDLYYHDGAAARWTVPVGVTYRHIMAISKTEYFIPQVTVAYLGDIYRKDPTVKYDWTSGSGTVNGSKVGRRGIEVEAGAAWVIDSQWSTGAFYTIENRDGDCYQQVKAYASYSF